MYVFPFSLSLYLLVSKNAFEFPENKSILCKINSSLGEGSYGSVFQLENNYAIKIFKSSIAGNVDLTSIEKDVLPHQSENRELLFYFESLQRNQDLYSCSIHHIIQPYAIGIILNKFNIFEKNTYFVILPLCIPFYKALPIINNPLIQMIQPTSIMEYFHKSHMSIPNIIENNNFGVLFTLHIMKKLCIASLYLENEYKIYNLDIKIQNIMFLSSHDKNIPFEDLIVIDFGLIRHKLNESELFSYENDIEKKYFIWPHSDTAYVSQIPSYSICINGLELLFGKNVVSKLPSHKITKKIINTLQDIDYHLYHIFHEGIEKKTSTKQLLSYIDSYLSFLK